MVVKFTNIAHWRSRIFARLLSLVAGLGLVAGVPSIALALRESMWTVAGIDTVALLWVLAVWRFDSLSYRVRVLNFLAIFFMIGVGMMLTVGPVSQVYLIALPVLASVLLSRRAALGLLFISAATILGLGLAGYASFYVNGMAEKDLAPSLVVTLNYLCIGALITISCSTLLSLLEKSINELHDAAESLEQGKEELQQLNAELRLTSAAVAQLNDMVLIARVDSAPGADQPIIFANEAVTRRTGYRRSEIVGQSMRMLHGADAESEELLRVRAAMARAEPVKTEMVSYTKTGDPYWLELDMVPFADEGGTNTHWVAIGRDVTERKKAAKDIHQLAFFDVLTGLPNRRMLMDRLASRMARAHPGSAFGAVMYIDLDNFKFINDARGHATGDVLLRSAAARLTKLMRKGDLVARLGGDEFVVLLDDLGLEAVGASSAALRVADKVRRAMTQPFDIDGQSYHSSASLGVSLLAHGGQTVEDILREADTAMYRAKADGRNSIMFFEENMQAEVQHRLALERGLAVALDNGELSMHTQLQVDAKGLPSGAELLMRWRRADGTMVPPDVFIPIAEATGLIVPLGHWALRQACLGWLALAAAGHAIPLSVNVSPSQFRQPDFVERVRAILADTGAPPAQLIFEITEGLLIDNLDATIGRMHELARMGIRFSIDDFGTGYSNLAYLKRMPLYELKIDKSFIRDTPADANGRAIVQSILAMAGHLGLRVVAEGVETQAQAQFLSEHGAPQMQGYLFARPLPLSAMIALLEERKAA